MNPEFYLNSTINNRGAIDYILNDPNISSSTFTFSRININNNPQNPNNPSVYSSPINPNLAPNTQSFTSTFSNPNHTQTNQNFISSPSNPNHSRVNNLVNNLRQQRFVNTNNSQSVNHSRNLETNLSNA